jgi:hypothetical protein
MTAAHVTQTDRVVLFEDAKKELETAFVTLGQACGISAEDAKKKDFMVPIKEGTNRGKEDTSTALWDLVLKDIFSVADLPKKKKQIGRYIYGAVGYLPGPIATYEYICSTYTHSKRPRAAYPKLLKHMVHELASRFVQVKDRKAFPDAFSACYFNIKAIHVKATNDDYTTAEIRARPAPMNTCDDPISRMIVKLYGEVERDSNVNDDSTVNEVEEEGENPAVVAVKPSAHEGKDDEQPPRPQRGIMEPDADVEQHGRDAFDDAMGKQNDSDDDNSDDEGSSGAAEKILEAARAGAHAMARARTSNEMNKFADEYEKVDKELKRLKKLQLDTECTLPDPCTTALGSMFVIMALKQSTVTNRHNLLVIEKSNPRLHLTEKELSKIFEELTRVGGNSNVPITDEDIQITIFWSMPADSAIAEKITNHPVWKKKYFVANAIASVKTVTEDGETTYLKERRLYAPMPRCVLMAFAQDCCGLHAKAESDFLDATEEEYFKLMDATDYRNMVECMSKVKFYDYPDMQEMYKGKDSALTQTEITQILEEHKGVKVRRSTLLGKAQLNKGISIAKKLAAERLSVVAGFPSQPTGTKLPPDRESRIEVSQTNAISNVNACLEC